MRLCLSLVIPTTMRMPLSGMAVTGSMFIRSRPQCLDRILSQSPTKHRVDMRWWYMELVQRLRFPTLFGMERAGQFRPRSLLREVFLGFLTGRLSNNTFDRTGWSLACRQITLKSGSVSGMVLHGRFLLILLQLHIRLIQGGCLNETLMSRLRVIQVKHWQFLDIMGTHSKLLITVHGFPLAVGLLLAQLQLVSKTFQDLQSRWTRFQLLDQMRLCCQLKVPEMWMGFYGTELAGIQLHKKFPRRQTRP
mmetsp:Transcript_2789/g.5109  ORF Transcript_2789/g.5109 Transcript_2789/m.5109 type:complete len:249 (+) Transcript_2789:1053-1799(+)